jgi:hypothetical protein
VIAVVCHSIPVRIYLGIEAGCSQGLRTLGRGVDLATNERALAMTERLGVYACYNMLVFDPDSTIDALRTSLGFVRRHAEVPMSFCRAEVYVGTPLMRRLAREGRLLGDVFGWDYEIADPAAERALRIFARVFFDRNFRADGLMNANLGLGYHLHLLRHYYPNGHTPSLRARTLALVREVNLDCVRRMESIFDFCESGRAAEADACEAFTERLACDTHEADARLEQAVAEMTARLTSAARTDRVQRAPLWKSVAAATLALSPLACPARQQIVDPLPPPDPPPPPVDGGAFVLEVEPADAGSSFATPPPMIERFRRPTRCCRRRIRHRRRIRCLAPPRSPSRCRLPTLCRVRPALDRPGLRRPTRRRLPRPIRARCPGSA